MLKILWVEDEYSEQKQASWFNNRSVCVKTSFDEAENTINHCLTQFDLIVLDINLENSEHTDRVKALAKQFKISEQAFLEESGMNLFLNLLEHGFPKEQIIFLTANADINISRIDELRECYRLGDDDAFDEILGAITNGLSEDTVRKCSELIEAEDIDGLCQYLENYFNNLIDVNDPKNTYNRFCDAYRRCRIEPPKAINKSLNEAKQHLNHWLENHERNDYLVLRRGVIEGCKFLKKHIKDDDNHIQFRRFVKGTKIRNPVIEILSDDIENYLETVAQFLPARKPTAPTEINDTLRLFLRTFVHEWEESIDPQETTEKYGGDIHTFAWLSKRTRNWVSHAKLLEPLSSQFITFLFLVNMRAMFKLPKAIQAYEKILMDCLSTSPEITIELENHIKNSENDIDGILACLKIPEYKVDKNGQQKFDKNGKEILKDFGEKINAIYRQNTGNPDAETHDYQKFLLHYFWVNQKSDLRNLTANSDDFLPTLARHIYSLSFP
jgi:CheY-like chemotaxis protein